ncbi:MAG: shikimate kinase [Lachnospiraceae bacterium]|nr:shikimate kinase [Lachnospiraceae bacterium]
MNIILIGFMGSGKSTMGIRLSYRMKQPYIDTDKYIERKAGRSISEIFETDGEDAFRQMETEALEALIADGIRDHVIATGGGMPMKEENHALLRKLGVVIWLRIRPESVLERLASDTSRPLLQRPDRETLIRDLMEKRAPMYAKCADVTVDVDDKRVERIMDAIFTKSRGVWNRKKRMKYE